MATAGNPAEFALSMAVTEADADTKPMPAVRVLPAAKAEDVLAAAASGKAVRGGHLPSALVAIATANVWDKTEKLISRWPPAMIALSSWCAADLEQYFGLARPPITTPSPLLMCCTRADLSHNHTRNECQPKVIYKIV